MDSSASDPSRPPIPTHNPTDAVGVALTPQASGLGDIDHLHRFGLQLALALKNQVLQRGHHNRRRSLLFRNKEMDSTSLSWGCHVGGYVPQLGDAKQKRHQAPFVSFGTTALTWSQHIDAVAYKLWPAGCVDPCFNSVTALSAVCRAGRKDHGPTPCNAAPGGSAAPPRM